ncbi:hypothetical protein X271_00435 [Candidatus Hepatoplasma crinochetorum Av]|uniref:Uncharacterized protein n=1 Tax=Candidatus Hepatoplasma crinochetorum Av TaxID=1427984 RepID=W8GSZ6_9MOLU|nr:hypothetical protein [Candidatus Hepatoplasma crinochetorum]AHK22540.1 hypothetical protein X271_00435 [Candidatus Hepatoplasma crinochetorum Av]
MLTSKFNLLESITTSNQDQIVAITEIIIAFVFLILTIWFFWMYFSEKREQWNSRVRRDRKNKSIGSFKGFWYEYKYHIIIFIGFLFLLISLGLFYLSISALV